MKNIFQFSAVMLSFVCLSAIAGGYDIGSKPIAHHHHLNENGSPVVSIGAPNAFGPTGTVVFMTGSYVNHWPSTSSSDGLMGLGASFGDPHKYVGVLVNLAFTNLGAKNESFGENGSFGIRLNRYLTANTALAFGVSAVSGWGLSSNISNSFYGALTHSFRVGLPMAINIGVGTGGFSKGGDVVLAQDKNVNPFIGYGVEIFKGMSILFDCAAKQVNVGATYAHIFGHSVPFFISVAGRNVNRHTGKAYFQATTGLAYIIS